MTWPEATALFGPAAGVLAAVVLHLVWPKRQVFLWLSAALVATPLGIAVWQGASALRTTDLGRRIGLEIAQAFLAGAILAALVAALAWRLRVAGAGRRKPPGS